jgi:hypothetical protein
MARSGLGGLGRVDCRGIACAQSEWHNPLYEPLQGLASSSSENQEAGFSSLLVKSLYFQLL